MATVTKDFRVKNGLIVEGTTGTINGNSILTTANDTGDLSEGTNLYFTEARAETAAANLLTSAALTNITITGDGDGLIITAENGVADSTTTDLTEGTNLYFTDQRAIDAIEGASSITLTGGLTLSGNPSANLEAATKQYVDSAVSNGIGDIDSDDVPEGTGNLYFTTERAQDAIGSAIAAGTQTNITVTYDDNANSISFVAENGVDDATTDELDEGTTNLYFTDARAQAAVAQDITDAINAVDTDDIEEGLSNLYFTDSRARSAVSAGTGITYNSGTGEFTIDDSVVVTESDLDVHTEATSGVHGVTGDVVGTTDTQTLSNKTLGSNLDADNNKITNVATPTTNADAANKEYVDEVAQGLKVRGNVEAATTTDLSATYSNGTNGVDATLTIPATATLDIDGWTSWSVGDGVLVKDQTNAEENGRYFINVVGDAVTDWVLKRCIDCDTAEEIPGSFVFVQHGTQHEATGWVASVDDSDTFAVGTDDVNWVQFSGAGTYTAGTNLTLNGTEFILNDSITLTSVTADLTGDVSGNVTGNLTGNVTGTVSDISNHTTTDLTEGSNLYFTDQRAVDALEAVVPNFTEVDVNSLAKQVAATSDLSDTTQTAVYSFDSGSYRSAKFVVKAAYGIHTEVSEILVTLDTSDNIAITEYAIVSTNGSLITVTAGMNGTDVEILATAGTANTDVTVVGTLIV